LGKTIALRFEIVRFKKKTSALRFENVKFQTNFAQPCLGRFEFFRKFTEIFAAQGALPVLLTLVANGKNLQ
jgi:hypothetical protein